MSLRLRRLLASLALALTVLGLGACTDPSSPVDPTHSPTYGVVLGHTSNTYGRTTFYYLRIRTNYGAYWVSVDWYDYLTCQRLEQWSRALGCRS